MGQAAIASGAGRHLSGCAARTRVTRGHSWSGVDMTASGYRALAAAVLIRAVRDAHGDLSTTQSGDVRKRIVQDACAFLDPENERLAFFCDAIDIEPASFIEAVKKRGNVYRKSEVALMPPGRARRHG